MHELNRVRDREAPRDKSSEYRELAHYAGRATPRHVPCSRTDCSLGAPGNHMAISNALTLARPAKDEWGVYDPQQAGLAALFARLDAKDKLAAAQGAPVKKEIADYPAAAPVFRDE